MSTARWTLAIVATTLVVLIGWGLITGLNDEDGDTISWLVGGIFARYVSAPLLFGAVGGHLCSRKGDMGDRAVIPPLALSSLGLLADLMNVESGRPVELWPIWPLLVGVAFGYAFWGRMK